MTPIPSRRWFLAGALSGAGSAVLAAGPTTSPRPVPRGGPRPPTAEALVAESRLSGQVAFALADAETGEVLEARGPEDALPPASVAKTATALYALDALGEDHVFETALVATGPVRNGSIDGDLCLVGGGDPVLDTDALAALAGGLKEAGIHEVRGAFTIDSGALPALPFIDADQPDQVGYNPSIDGLNLNFNRVHFEWKRNGSGYETTMQARGLRASPGVGVARMEIVDRPGPVYTYARADGIDQWTVARGALGREGARWLPVREPAAYTADVFRTLARSHGIDLKAPVFAPCPGGEVLVRWLSPGIRPLLTDMLDYSTNLTAEVMGLTASAALGPATDTLAASAARMNGWLRARHGLQAPAFVDHSGLGYGSAVSAGDLVRMLVAARRLEPLLEEIPIGDTGLVTRAKTGTLNFVSALSGYITAGGGRPLAYAILTADIPRRDAIPPEQRERPDGARPWAQRSRTLQRALLARWAAAHSA